MKTAQKVKTVRTVKTTCRQLTCFAILLTIFSIPPALAVKTERWEINTPQEFMRGKLARLIVTSEGELRLGHASQHIGEFAKEIWCSTTGQDGTIYFATGSPADVYAIGKDGRATKLFQTDSIAVTALALDSRGNLYAATMAEGKIFKIPAGKDAKGAEFCKLPAPYVWSLAVDNQDRLFAGTGPDGKIYRIGADGTAEEWFAAEESNILSLALDAGGGPNSSGQALLAGGSDRGLLYRVAEKGKGAVLHEFAEEEVKSLAVSGEQLFIGVNKQKIRRPRLPARRPSAAEFEDLTQRLTSPFGAPVAADGVARPRETPPEARLADLLSGALFVRNADGRVDRLAHWENESVLDLKMDRDGAALVAMAGAGRVYRVLNSRRWELLFDFDEQQALTLALRDGRLAFVGTGNVGSAYTIDAQPASDGQFTSEVRDCRFLTTWGNLSWMGRGAIEISTRTGNTALPDATWSEWTEPLRGSLGKVTSPRARFIQVRAQLSSASDPLLQSLSIHYQIQNQKPEVASIDVGEKPKPAPERTRPDTAEKKPDAIDATDTERAERPTAERKPEEFRPKAATPIKKIHWRASDKDGDTLVYRLFYQADGEDFWVPVSLDKPLKKTEYSWNTESIPDAWYRIKVLASDEESNPAGQALSDEKISHLVKVDNRRPEVLELSYDAPASTLTGIARDNLSLIRFLEYSVDGGEWKFFAPRDGVFDDRQEPFEVKLDPPAAGPHFIAVRATDEEGNIGVEKVTLKVSP